MDQPDEIDLQLMDVFGISWEELRAAQAAHDALERMVKELTQWNKETNSNTQPK